MLPKEPDATPRDTENHRQRAIFLVGFMGAGKTTVGRSLAAELGLAFVDLDDVIRERTGRTTAQLIDAIGEAAFRPIETDALASLACVTEAVVALGSGAYVQESNRKMLASWNAWTVFLDAPVEVLLSRCRSQGIDRPLARDWNLFRQLYQARHPIYRSASTHIDASGEVEEIVREIKRAIEMARQEQQ